MAKVIVKNEDTHFEKEAECVLAITITSGSEKTDAATAFVGKFRLKDGAYMIGKGIRGVLDKIAGENTIARMVVWDSFVEGLFDED